MPGADRPSAENLNVRITGRSYLGRAVLGDIAFEAGPGEVLALLGPSGTGKTTTLRIATGLDRGFGGAVSRPAGRLGVVFQEPLLLPWLDVAANLRLVEPGLDDAAITRLLDVVGLPETAHLLPRQLSLGMARRIAFARALAVRPSLLVLDEPFASLDPRLAALLATVTTEAARDLRCTVLMATHDLDQAVQVAGRILILAGTPASLAADVACPPVPGRAAFARSLRIRFPFLEGVTGS